MDNEGKMPINVSLSTGGLGTCQVWLERGFDFEVQISGGRDNVFVACEYGITESLKFLENEVKMNLHRVKDDGENSLEYTLKKASFDSFFYLVDYYSRKGLFNDIEGLREKLTTSLLQICIK